VYSTFNPPGRSASISLVRRFVSCGVTPGFLTQCTMNFMASLLVGVRVMWRGARVVSFTLVLRAAQIDGMPVQTLPHQDLTAGR
jgi:hypothetical protein